MRTAAEYETQGYAEMSARVAAGCGWWISDCPYRAGWQRIAWQAGAWRHLQEIRVERRSASRP